MVQLGCGLRVSGGLPPAFPRLSYRQMRRREPFRVAATLSDDDRGGGRSESGGADRGPSPPSAATRWPDCPLPPRPRWSDDRYELIMLQQRMTAVLRSMDAKAASGDFTGALVDRDALLPLQLRERHLLLQVTCAWCFVLLAVPGYGVVSRMCWHVPGVCETLPAACSPPPNAARATPPRPRAARQDTAAPAGHGGAAPAARLQGCDSQLQPGRLLPPGAQQAAAGAGLGGVPRVMVRLQYVRPTVASAASSGHAAGQRSFEVNSYLWHRVCFVA